MWLQAKKIKAVIRLDKWSWPPVGHIKPKRHIFTRPFQNRLQFSTRHVQNALSFVENFSRLQKQLHLKWKQFQNPLKFLKKKVILTPFQTYINFQKLCESDLETNLLSKGVVNSSTKDKSFVFTILLKRLVIVWSQDRNLALSCFKKFWFQPMSQVLFK